MLMKAISRSWKAGYNRVKQLWKRTFFPIGHFYSPIPDRAEAKTASENAARARDAIPGAIVINDEAMQSLWRDSVPFMNEAPFSDTAEDGQRFQYLNGYYSYGDALMLHAMIRREKPVTYLEIGSGYSTAAALDTRDLCGHPKSVVCVEPYPKRLRSLLLDGDEQSTQIIEHKVQETSTSLYEKLSAGDFLFIDSSHVMKTGSDDGEPGNARPSR